MSNTITSLVKVFGKNINNTTTIYGRYINVGFNDNIARNFTIGQIDVYDIYGKIISNPFINNKVIITSTDKDLNRLSYKNNNKDFPVLNKLIDNTYLSRKPDDNVSVLNKKGLYFTIDLGESYYIGKVSIYNTLNDFDVNGLIGLTVWINDDNNKQIYISNSFNNIGYQYDVFVNMKKSQEQTKINKKDFFIYDDENKQKQSQKTTKKIITKIINNKSNNNTDTEGDNDTKGDNKKDCEEDKIDNNGCYETRCSKKIFDLMKTNTSYDLKNIPECKNCNLNFIEQQCILDKKQCKINQKVNLGNIILQVLNKELRKVLNNKYKLAISNFKYEIAKTGNIIKMTYDMEFFYKNISFYKTNDIRYVMYAFDKKCRVKFFNLSKSLNNINLIQIAITYNTHKDFPINIDPNDPNIDEFPDDGFYEEICNTKCIMEEDSSKIGIILLIVIVVILLIVGIYYFISKRKTKKTII